LQKLKGTDFIRLGARFKVSDEASVRHGKAVVVLNFYEKERSI